MRGNGFRAWDKRSSRWDQDRLYLYIDENGELYEIFEAYSSLSRDCVTYEYEVTWFTGLYDSKRTEKYPYGQKIYEGDVVNGTHFMNGKEHRIIGQVVFVGAKFCIDGIGKYKGIMRIELDSSYEVIGNVFENPELLEGESDQ